MDSICDHCGDFPGRLVVKTSPSNARVLSSIPGRELRSHMPSSQKQEKRTKTLNGSNIVTHAIKTFKNWSTSKKKKKTKTNNFQKATIIIDVYLSW